MRILQIILKSAENEPIETRLRRCMLASALVAFSHGVAFFHAGDEILRSKSLDRDSYNSGGLLVGRAETSKYQMPISRLHWKKCGFLQCHDELLHSSSRCLMPHLVLCQHDVRFERPSVQAVGS